MSKLIKKFKSGMKLLLVVSAFVAISCVTSTAQTSIESSTKPSATVEPTPEPAKIVTISQADADRCANNTRELIAARDEIEAYVAEIGSREKRDAATEKAIATYERLLVSLDKVIDAQNNLSGNQGELIKEQQEFIRTVLAMREKKSSPLVSVLKFVAGIFIGRAL